MSERKKIRCCEEYNNLITRLSKIEGQVRGVKKMVENNAYCPDILFQVKAITAALNSFNKELLSNHLKTCVYEDIKNGNDEAVDEIIDVINKMMR